MKIIEIDDYDSFIQLFKQYSSNDSVSKDHHANLILLFVASEDPATKESWCSDCRDCKQVLQKAIEQFKYNEQLDLAMVHVGQRDEWKRDDNPYRIHQLQITAVPTLLSIKTNQRLVEKECNDLAKVTHLFSNSM